MEAPSPQRYDLDELCERAGVTPRTVRYYIQIGLLPSPGMGAGTRYAQSHLDRLRFIRLLQARHIPLHEIAQNLATLDDAAIAAAVATSAREVPAPGTAADYLRGLLESGVGGASGRTGAKRPAAAAPRSPLPPTSVAEPVAGDSTGARRREHWEHIALTDDVMLQVRRPLSRELNRRIERLIAAARRILDDQN
jgi:DNA-binding transcriptional MerR regulator